MILLNLYFELEQFKHYSRLVMEELRNYLAFHIKRWKKIFHGTTNIPLSAIEYPHTAWKQQFRMDFNRRLRQIP